MTDKKGLDYALADTRGVPGTSPEYERGLEDGLAWARGPKPKVKATKQELVAALREILYIQRADDARKIAERVLGE